MKRNIAKQISLKEEEVQSLSESHRENAGKINELHHYMKSYFQEVNIKKLSTILPKIKEVKNEIKQYEQNIMDLDMDELSVENRKQLLIKKNQLISKIKKMVKEL